MGTRESLLLHSLQLFSKYGYDNVGVRKILDEVGVKKPTLYHYFGSKQGLLKEILEIHYTKLMNLLNETKDKPDDIIYTLEKIAKAFFTFAKENRDFYKLYFSIVYSAEKSETKETNTEYYNEVHNFIKDYFKYVNRNRDNLKDKNKQLTLSFIGTINTYISLFLYDDYELNDNTVYLVVKQYIYGIFSL